MRTVPRLALTSVVALVLLGGCASPDEPAPEDTSTSSVVPTTPAPFRGVPDGVDASGESPAGIVVGADGLIRVITFGSSSNPRIVHGATATGQTVEVDIRDVPGRPATRDYSPTTSAFVLPDGVDPAEPVTFALGQLGTVRLDSITPGAQGWVEVPG